MIWRIRDRAAFTRLRVHGRRARRGPVTVTALLDPELAPPRVGFAVGTAVGPAVVRNRIRRRLRAVMVQASADGDVPPGLYLLGARPDAATLPFPVLERAVRDAVRQATRAGAS